VAESTNYEVTAFVNVGPNTEPRHLVDTIESAQHWLGGELAVTVVTDDSGRRDVRTAIDALTGVHRIVTPRPGSGMTGGLYLVTGLSLLACLDVAASAVIMQLDTDALVVGPKPNRDAVDYLAANPRVGLAGSYRVTCTGVERDFGSAQAALRHDLVSRSPRARALRKKVTQLYAEAQSHGYEDGEHVLGAAYFMTRSCIEQLRDAGYLTASELGRSTMADDQLLSLAVIAAGWSLGDLASGGGPLAVSWKGLPWPPAEIQRRRKKIIHSTKDQDGLREDEIREFFRRLRGEPQLTWGDKD